MLRPLNKRILAKLIQEEEQKKGALILTAKEPKKDRYEVLAVAENEQGIKVGDKILIDKYDALEKEIDGQHYHIIQCDRVLGVIE
jgi:co-chaperonin GroES (HSP10)